jgi:hypothetical protein
VTRSIIDIGALDLAVQERLLSFGSLKDFHIALWRHEPDASGCNWNGSIGRANGGVSEGLSLDLIIPQLRNAFNVG